MATIQEVRLQDALAEAGMDGVPYEIDHPNMRTKVGNLERPVVFSKKLSDNLKGLWREQRTVKVAFRGLGAPNKVRELEEWKRTHPEENPEITYTYEGRLKENQSYHSDYFDLLGRCQFVLCPSGADAKEGTIQAWTYRVYESCLCGAVPVSYFWCSQYDGIEMLRWGDPLPQYNPDIAKRNYELVRERVVSDPERLKSLSGL